MSAPIAFGLFIPLLRSPESSAAATTRVARDIVPAAIVGHAASLPRPLARPCSQLAAELAPEPTPDERSDWTTIDALFIAAEAGRATVDDVLDLSVELLSRAEPCGENAEQAGGEHACRLLDVPSRGTVSLAAWATGDRSEQWEMSFDRAAEHCAKPASFSMLYRVADDGKPECYSLLVPARATGGVLSIHQDSASWNGRTHEMGDESDESVDRVRWEDPVTLSGSLDDSRAVLVAEALQRFRQHLDRTRESADSETSGTAIPPWRSQ